MNFKINDLTVRLLKEAAQEIAAGGGGINICTNCTLCSQYSLCSQKAVTIDILGGDETAATIQSPGDLQALKGMLKSALKNLEDQEYNG